MLRKPTFYMWPWDQHIIFFNQYELSSDSHFNYLFTEYLNITCSVYIVRIIYDENIWNPRKGKEKISVTPTPYVGLVPTEFGILSRKLDRSCQGVTITQISGDGANMLSAQTRLNSPVVIAINTCIGKNKTWYIFVFLRGFT